jgi:hypothetical protein
MWLGVNEFIPHGKGRYRRSAGGVNDSDLENDELINQWNQGQHPNQMLEKPTAIGGRAERTHDRRTAGWAAQGR